MTSAAQFAVTLHHLAPDAKRAGVEFTDKELKAVTPDQLRKLLESFAALAPKVQYPAAPELRIGGPHGRFLVQAKGGQVRVTSWSAKGGGSDLTPERIYEMIMGIERSEDDDRASTRGMPGVAGRISQRWRIILLVVGVGTTNGVTAWLLTRPPPPPPPEIFPAYQTVAPERAERMFAEFAGDFATGTKEGDRRLIIARDGKLSWIQLGPNQTVAEETALTAQAAESRGRPVLVADNFGMIEMKDPITITYFGDTYRRKEP